MNIESNDTNIFLLNSILLILGILLWYYKYNYTKYCLLQYIVYGMILLPGLYLIASLVGISAYVPKEIGYIFFIFGLFYLPYMVALAIPAIIIESIGIKFLIENNFLEHHKLIVFASYIIFWIILVTFIGYIICKRNKM